MIFFFAAKRFESIVIDIGDQTQSVRKISLIAVGWVRHLYAFLRLRPIDTAPRLIKNPQQIW